MATYSITDVMVRLKGLPERVAERAVEIMKEKVPYGEGIGGHLRDTIKAEKMADNSYTVSTNKYTTGPYGIREVGAIIRAGRPELWPRYQKALRWENSSGVHYAKHVGPADKNDFLEQTKEQLEQEIRSKGLSI